MLRKSERPTTPPSFDVVQFAKNTDARSGTVLPRPTDSCADGGDDEASSAPRSETRIVSRPAIPAVDSDESWAAAMMGAPVVVMPYEKLFLLPLDHRAGFLMSLMDGTMDLDTLVEVSPISREEALRLVRNLFESRVIAFR
jgi:hypothetical protein